MYNPMSTINPGRPALLAFREELMTAISEGFNFLYEDGNYPGPCQIVKLDDVDPTKPFVDDSEDGECPCYVPLANVVNEINQKLGMHERETISPRIDRETWKKYVRRATSGLLPGLR